MSRAIKKVELTPQQKKILATKRRLADIKQTQQSGPITRFKRVRTSTKGKKIVEIVERRKGGVKPLEKSVAAKVSNNFPVSFQDYYKWLNEDVGWQMIDERLGDARDAAYEGSNEHYDGTPQSALRAYKSALKAADGRAKKLRIRDRGDNKELKLSIDAIKQKMAKSKATVKIKQYKSALHAIQDFKTNR